MTQLFEHLDEFQRYDSSLSFEWFWLAIWALEGGLERIFIFSFFFRLKEMEFWLRRISNSNFQIHTLSLDGKL